MAFVATLFKIESEKSGLSTKAKVYLSNSRTPCPLVRTFGAQAVPSSKLVNQTRPTSIAFSPIGVLDP